MYEYLWAQRLGFKVPITVTTTGSVVFSDLLSVNTDEPTDWTLHLNALRYQGGTVFIGATQPLDNQVQSLAGSSPSGWKVNIFFGGADGNENVVVDYYARGNSIGLYGSYIRVGLSGNINAGNSGLPPPILSGFLVERPRSSQLIQSPTFTTATFTLAPAGQRDVPIPDRAVAYRYINPSQVVVTRNVRQTDAGGGGGTTIQTDLVTGAPPIAASTEQSNSAGYIPLNPAAQFVTVLDQGAGTSFAIQFMLDLG